MLSINKEYRYMVATRCWVYNHISLVEDALCGFTMQKTTFPVVYLIVDDASTDGSQEVLRNWVNDNIIPRNDLILWNEYNYGQQCTGHLKGNSLSYFVILLLKENHYQQGKSAKKIEYISEWLNNAKYHALCEGDDFWFRPYKLQRQVDFLESHLDYTMCFHNAVISYEDVPKSASIFNTISEDREVTLNELMKNWIVPTASIMFKSSVLPVFPVDGTIISGDWRLILHCAACGKVYGMKDVMSVYRMTYNSSSLTSLYSDKGAMMYQQQVFILNSLDTFTKGQYHQDISYYASYFTKMAKFHKICNEKGLMRARISMPLFYLKKQFEKLKKTK